MMTKLWAQVFLKTTFDLKIKWLSNLWTVTAHMENTKKKGLFETITTKKFGCEILISEWQHFCSMSITMSDHNIKQLGDYYSVQAIFFSFFFIFNGCHFLWFVLRSSGALCEWGTLLPKLHVCNLTICNLETCTCSWWLTTINNWPSTGSKLHCTLKFSLKYWVPVVVSFCDLIIRS